ncbi:MAG TPA: SAM-dependent methyltransferase [Vicinamibacterales bacterium]|nr:SAM-dependent methyltransferase [Vicinamibacterales bacterium]
MTSDPTKIRNISDTALWAAIYRADETARPDALFRDPLAGRLAGERGRAIRAALPKRAQRAWPWVTRTVLFDRFITDAVNSGVDLVLNLAAGLDTRPYRMPLPASLQWIEVDLPDLLDYKEDLLKGERPNCALERMRIDLSDRVSRQELFSIVGLRAKRAFVITEGLLIYLSPEDVAAFAEDVAKPPAFQRWLIDLASPGLLQLLRKEIGSELDAANAPMKFGPEEGVDFFRPHGWQPAEVQSMIKTAAKIRRLPLFMRLIALLPESPRPGQRPWSGICLLERREPRA